MRLWVTTTNVHVSSVYLLHASLSLFHSWVSQSLPLNARLRLGGHWEVYTYNNWISVRICCCVRSLPTILFKEGTLWPSTSCWPDHSESCWILGANFPMVWTYYASVELFIKDILAALSVLYTVASYCPTGFCPVNFIKTVRSDYNWELSHWCSPTMWSWQIPCLLLKLEYLNIPFID